MLPPVAGTSPRKARPSVVLPLPDSPTSPSTSPRRRARFTPSMALTARPRRPSRRARALPCSANVTSRSWASTTASRLVSGFVGNRDHLLRERDPLALGEGDEAVGHVGRPAFDPAAVGHLPRHGCASGAHLHGVRAAGVEPAAGWG